MPDLVASRPRDSLPNMEIHPRYLVSYISVSNTVFGKPPVKRGMGQEDRKGRKVGIGGNLFHLVINGFTWISSCMS